MTMKYKKTDLWKKAASFAGQIGLPAAFQSLEIKGLGKVAASSEISHSNKENIFRFLSHIAAEVSELRMTFYTHKLRKIAEWLQKDFEAATKEDLQALMILLTKGKAREDGGAYSKGSVHGFRVTIKRFYKWLEGEDEEYPDKVKWIKTSGCTTRIRSAGELLTIEEIEEMIRHAKNPRDKAIIAFLYDSGSRISEMLSMKVKHIEFFEKSIKVTLPVSKTRPRAFPLSWCKIWMDTWMNNHPLNDDPEAPLWSNLVDDGRTPLLNQTVNHILKAIASKAGIKKRVYPHLFRACSITHKQRQGFPESHIKEMHGLSKDTGVMKHYSHPSYDDLEESLMRMNGIPVEKKNDPMQGIKCPACGERNPVYKATCACGLPTQIRRIPGGQDNLEKEVSERMEKMEKEMESFKESRSGYDQLMVRFLEGIVKKSDKSPELREALIEITREIQSSGATIPFPVAVPPG